MLGVPRFSRCSLSGQNLKKSRSAGCPLLRSGSPAARTAGLQAPPGCSPAHQTGRLSQRGPGTTGSMVLGRTLPHAETGVNPGSANRGGGKCANTRPRRSPARRGAHGACPGPDPAPPRPPPAPPNSLAAARCSPCPKWGARELLRGEPGAPTELGSIRPGLRDSLGGAWLDPGWGRLVKAFHTASLSTPAGIRAETMAARSPAVSLVGAPWTLAQRLPSGDACTATRQRRVGRACTRAQATRRRRPCAAHQVLPRAKCVTGLTVDTRPGGLARWFPLSETPL